MTASWGTFGDDDLTGTAAGETIEAFAGYDFVSGLGGDDLLSGGDDVLSGGADSDSLIGGEGNDTQVGGAGADRLELGDGPDDVRSTLAEVDGDTIDGFGNGDHLRIAGATEVVSQTRDDPRDTIVVLSDGGVVTATLTFVGGLPKNLSLQSDSRLILSGISVFDDVIPGTNHPVTISALVGDDKVFGYGGPDHLYGGDGNDTLVGGQEHFDQHSVSKGDDHSSDDNGKSEMWGGTGNDTLDASEARSKWWWAKLDDGTGDAPLKGGSGSDTLVSGADNDTLAGGRCVDPFVLKTVSGADVITDFNARGGEVIDLVAWNFGEVDGDGEKKVVGPVFADFKGARISENAEGHAVITLSEGYQIILLGVAGDDLTVANFAFV